MHFLYQDIVVSLCVGEKSSMRETKVLHDDCSLVRQDKIKTLIYIICNLVLCKWFLNFLMGNLRAYGGCLG